MADPDGSTVKKNWLESWSSKSWLRDLKFSSLKISINPSNLGNIMGISWECHGNNSNGDINNG